jgi:hypothetical protein
MSQLAAFLGVKAPGAEDVHAVLADKHNAQLQGQFAHWTQWSPAERDTLLRIAGETAAILGYDLRS